MSATPLTDIIQLIDRSIFHSIRQEIVDKGYLPDILETIDTPVVGVTIGAGGTFTIGPGDFTGIYTAGRTFDIALSTGNDNTYTIASSAVNGPDTDVVIIGAESIPDATVDGQAEMRKYFNDPVGVALFEADLLAIKNSSKDFAVEIFGVGSSQSKHLKKVPRIVIVQNRVLPGDIGGDPGRAYIPIGPDPLAPDSFDAIVLPPQTVSFQYDIHIVTNQARQSRLCHELVALGLPKRGYFDAFKPSQPELGKFFCYNYSYRDIPNPSKGIDERIYLYEVRDIFETDAKTVENNISPIKEITVEQHDNLPNEPNTELIDQFVVD